MPPRRKKSSTAQRKMTPRSKKGLSPVPNEAEDHQNSASEDTAVAEEEAALPGESAVQEEASAAISKEEHGVADESTVEGAAGALPSEDAVLELSMEVKETEQQLTTVKESVGVEEPVSVAGNGVLEPSLTGEVKKVVDEWEVSGAEEAGNDFIREPEEIDEGDGKGCDSKDADEGVDQEMVEEENEVFDNEAVEGGGDDVIMADDGMREDEEDTGVGKVENSVGSEDNSDADEDGSGGDGSNDEVDEDDEDDDGLEEEADEGGSNDEDEGTDDEDEEGENYDSDEGTEEEEDPSEYMDSHLTDRKKGDFEIFVSRLDKKAVEDDLQEAFAPFGPIQEVRIVRHPVTQKSKGFAFIRYAAAEHAKKALSELKDGAEVVKGKLVRVLASQDNYTLYVGNICKKWTKDNVLATLKEYGIEQIEEIILPGDPKKEGSSKGFAFLEFGTHSDAMAAFQRLRKPDAVFGSDRSAKIAFAQSLHPSKEALLQVKTVFVEGLPASWDEDRLEEQCKKYGKIEEVRVPRKSGKKHRGFGFIEFSSRGCAIACVKGINDDKLGDGEIKVKANLARPPIKGRLAKIGARGGFKVKNNEDNEENTEADPPNPERNPKNKTSKEKQKAHAKSNNSKESKHSKGKHSNGQVGGPSLAAKIKEQELKGQDDSPQGHGRKKISSKHQGRPSEGPQRKNQASRDQDGGPSRNSLKKKQQQGGVKRSSRDTDSTRPSKRARHNRNVRGRPTQDSGQKKSRVVKPKTFLGIHQAVGMDPYTPRYVAPAVSYQGHVYHAAAGSRYSYSDMRPHAGYLENAHDRVRNQYVYDGRSALGYDSQARIGAGYIAGSFSLSSDSTPTQGPLVVQQEGSCHVLSMPPAAC
ncbi:hypothetical protein ACLOJK_005380 [Asimina triloba]